MAAPCVVESSNFFPPENRQKTMRLCDADAIGFDLDHTLAKYSLTDLFPLIFDGITGYLVEKKGYNSSLLLEPFEKYKDLCFRGLVFDTNRGNVLKVSSDGIILRANHGTKPMDCEKIREIYGEKCIFPHTDILMNNVNNIEFKWVIMDNYFDMPYGLAGARVVDVLDNDAGHVIGQYDFWSDMVEAINYAYNPKHFALDIGPFFPVMKREMKNSIFKVKTEVQAWLKLLRSKGVITFMLTSSYNDYSDSIMEWILDGDWQQYFDLNLTLARKPGFFTKENPFMNIKNGEEVDQVTELERGKCYSQGNAKTLTDFVITETGKTEPNIIYVGDSMRSDIFTAKKYANWQTIFLLDEMRAEGWTDSVDTYPSEKTLLVSKRWGSFFHDDTQTQNGKRYLNTLWTRLIYTYSDLVIPGLEYISNTAIDHEFQVFSAGDEKSCGFYPAPPLSLKY